VGLEMILTITREKETHRDEIDREFRAILIEYITKVNSRYRGNEFTSSQLAKTVMTAMETENTRFPIIHRIVKEILRTWEKQGLCTHVTRTKYSRCRKTKDTYRFNSKGLKEIKKQAIEQMIETIEREELKAVPIMRTRQSIILDRLERLIDSISVSP
jgi:DNA-binding PadR family transcriptional regulator